MAPNPLLRSQAAASAQKFVRRDVRRRHRVQRPRGNADVSSAGVERPRGADWCDRIGGLRGVACGHLRDADEDVGVPGDTGQTTDHEVIVSHGEADDVDASSHADYPPAPCGLFANPLRIVRRSRGGS